MDSLNQEYIEKSKTRFCYFLVIIHFSPFFKKIYKHLVSLSIVWQVATRTLLQSPRRVIVSKLAIFGIDVTLKGSQ